MLRIKCFWQENLVRNIQDKNRTICRRFFSGVGEFYVKSEDKIYEVALMPILSLNSYCFSALDTTLKTLVSEEEFNKAGVLLATESQGSFSILVG